MTKDARRFSAAIEGFGPGACVAIPFDVHEAYGTRGQVKVKATLDGAPYRGSIAPMGGRHLLLVRKDIRRAIGKDVGDRVRVVLERDTEPRTVEVPADLDAAMRKVPRAHAAFEKLSYTHRKEYVRWIEEAKKPETRARRLEKTIAMLVEVKRP